MSPMSSFLALLVLGVCLDLSVCRPAEEPTKFSLSTDDKNVETAVSKNPSRLDQGKDFLGRIADGIRIGRGRFVNSITLARNIIADQTELLASEARNNVASVIAGKTDVLDKKRSILGALPTVPVAPSSPKFRVTAKLESAANQGLLEKPIQHPVERILESFVRPTPIVDGISEKEKYGNNGDKFIGVSRAFINGYEGLSNFLNAIVDFPKNAAKKASEGLTVALNQIGGKLVGLQ